MKLYFYFELASLEIIFCIVYKIILQALWYIHFKKLNTYLSQYFFFYYSFNRRPVEDNCNLIIIPINLFPFHYSFRILSQQRWWLWCHVCCWPVGNGGRCCLEERQLCGCKQQCFNPSPHYGSSKHIQ